MKRTDNTLSSLIILLCVSLASLALFLNKAFHIDDPLFLWAAGWIQSHPLDFYGFTVNWYGYEMPMFAVTKNPPLASYYIAGVAYFFGWDEITLHLAFLIPACAAAIGSFYLARQFCLRPLAAALVSISTPVFLVSSTTVMCDTMMMAFWVWATYLWLRGMENDSLIFLLSSAFLIALSSLTKYYGMSLIPLLFVYSFVRRRRLGYWSVTLLLPVLLLAGYQFFTDHLYGRGLLGDASSYALRHQYFKGDVLFQKTVRGLSFMGGCFITALFFLLPPRRWGTMLAGVVATLLLVAVSYLMRTPDSLRLYDENGMHWLFAGQFSLFLLAGITVLFLAASDLWRSRDADALLLALWVAGTFVFATFLNWSVNGRSVLPIAPVIGILIARRAEQFGTAAGGRLRLLLAFIPSLCVALFVTWSDYSLADSARTSAATLTKEHKTASGKLWFDGHWGFQYYMEAGGGVSLAHNKSTVMPGDIVILPSNNTNVHPPPPEYFRLIRVFQTASARFGTTLNGSVGAAFYSDLWGPLPFFAGPIPLDEYYVLVAIRPYAY